MSQPYLGEIRLFAGNFNPDGWQFCEGQLISIATNESLFNLIGTTYGGDGQETFALPDLRGRVPIHFGKNGGIDFTMGEQAGVEQVTLTTQQIPLHSHSMIGSQDNGSQKDPTNNILAGSTTITPYASETPAAAMAANSISPIGGSLPHENMQPYLALNYIISMLGLYPQQS
jgi:microcystin-dependent protein